MNRCKGASQTRLRAYTGESGASCTDLRNAHNHQQISNFRELLPCVTLWIAALSQGNVGKILTHPPPAFMRYVQRGDRDRGGGSNVKGVP